MRHMFEVFRIAFDQGRSQRETTRGLGLAQSTVHAYLRQFHATRPPWPVPPTLDAAAVSSIV